MWPLPMFSWRTNVGVIFKWNNPIFSSQKAALFKFKEIGLFGEQGVATTKSYWAGLENDAERKVSATYLDFDYRSL